MDKEKRDRGNIKGAGMKKDSYRIIIVLGVMLIGVVLHFFLPGLNIGLFRLINNTHFLFLDKIMLPITYCGNTVVILIAIAGVWRLKGGKKFLQAILPLIIAGILVHIIKRCFPSPRPAFILGNVHILGQILYMYTFPSGHTASIFALFVFVKKEFSRLFSLYLVVAVLVAISRVYTGTHFPADVIFGAGLGYLVGQFCFLMFDRKFNR